MNPDQRFGVKRLLDIFAYLANDHALAEESWNQFVEQLEMAAIISGTVGGQEHADGVTGLQAREQAYKMYDP